MYVGDIILAENSISKCDKIKVIRDQNLLIKELNLLKYFLGLKVAHLKEMISISQRKYCLDMWQEYGLLGSKSSCIPLDPLIKLHKMVINPFKTLVHIEGLLIAYFT